MPIVRVGRPGLIATAARTAVIAGTAQAVTGAVAGRQADRRAQQAQPAAEPYTPVPAPVPPVPAPAAPAATGGDDLIAQLERLAQLHSAGMIDAAEFAAAKARLLG